MLTETLKAIFERDLNRVITELKHYNSEGNIWRIAPGIANSAGNLVLEEDVIDTTKRKGTKVTFIPDEAIFKNYKLGQTLYSSKRRFF